MSESQTSKQPVSVLFVCLGNICRSPMAEACFRHLTRDPPHPLISRIDSCGTAAYHVGSAPDPRTISTLRSNAALDDYRHRARRVNEADFEQFQWIFGMDADNIQDLLAMRARVAKAKAKGKSGSDDDDEQGLAKVMLFGEFGGKGKRKRRAKGGGESDGNGEEVVDPYYGGQEGFAVAYEQMMRFGRAFLKSLEDDEQDES